MMGHVLNNCSIPVCQGSSKTPSYWQLLVIWTMQSFPSWVKCLCLPLRRSTPIGITVPSAPVSSLKVTGCPLSCKVTNQESFLPVLLSARLHMYTASNISELSKNTSFTLVDDLHTAWKCPSFPHLLQVAFLAGQLLRSCGNPFPQFGHLFCIPCDNCVDFCIASCAPFVREGWCCCLP